MKVLREALHICIAFCIFFLSLCYLLVQTLLLNVTYSEEDGGANLECDTSGLDATMQEIAESLQELGDQSPVAVHRTVVRKSDEAADTTNEAEDEDDDDSDSEDEGGK